MSTCETDVQNDAGYSSDEGPPELTWEEIQNSVYEFDPIFEFDAPQWFDFSDRKAMYAYDQDTRNGVRDGQEAEDDWFAVEHEGHDPEFYEFGAYANNDFTDDIDIGFGSHAAQTARTPKKPMSPPKRVLMTSPPQSSPQEPFTPSHPRRRALTSALSPTSLASKLGSPMRGGALRVPIAAQTADSSTSKYNESPDESSNKRSGPQRLLVLESPPPTTTPPALQNTRTTTSPSSISPKSAGSRFNKPSSKSPTKITKVPTPMPRYHDTSKPVAVSQCPPRSIHANTTGSRRVYPGNITKRHQPTNTQTLSSTQTAKAPSPQASQTTKKATVHSPSAPSTENALLSKVDAVLNSAKTAKQAPAYEPRRFGIKEIKAWELRSGRRWHELDAEERQHANKEMDDFRRLNGVAAH